MVYLALEIVTYGNIVLTKVIEQDERLRRGLDWYCEATDMWVKSYHGHELIDSDKLYVRGDRPQFDDRASSRRFETERLRDNYILKLKQTIGIFNECAPGITGDNISGQSVG